MTDAEKEIRRWKPMLSGGHDPEAMRALQEAIEREQQPRRCLRDVLPGNQPRNGGDCEEKK